MRLHFIAEGGVAHFPGLARPAEISTDDLPAKEAEELERRVRSARPFGQPPRATAEVVPDGRRYTLKVREGSGREETLVFRDPAVDPAVSDLLAELQRHSSRRAGARKAREKEIVPGVYVVEGVAPKAGTRLTPERIAADFRFLNRPDGGTRH